MSRHVSTLDLHRMRYGELSPEQGQVLRSHIAGCELCAERERVQHADRAGFVLTPLPPSIAALEPPPRISRRWWSGLALLLAAAVALVVVLPQLSGAPDTPTERAKGSTPDLEVWIATETGPRPLRADEALRAGDTVQLLFDPHGASEVWLAGRDGAGTVEVYGRVTPDGEGLQPAPFALTLDDTPGAQEFVVLIPNARIDAMDVKMWLSRNVDPPGEWTRLRVRKE
ncbi:MAG: hypothetical protein ACI8PZ_006408 [Myxococcota bacterium]|jgi:hypothetical protein